MSKHSYVVNQMRGRNIALVLGLVGFGLMSFCSPGALLSDPQSGETVGSAASWMVAGLAGLLLLGAAVGGFILMKAGEVEEEELPPLD